MTEKRFVIKDSSLVEGAKVIVDNKGKYTFPITKDESTLVVYEKILVKQDMMIESQEKQLQKQHRVIEEQDTTIKRLKTIREEQIQTILKQKRKIKELTAQLQTDDSCSKCKHEYLVKQDEGYFIAKCKKGHNECSKEDIRFCEDFDIK